MLKAGWMSHDHTPSTQKQAGGMSGDNPLPKQTLEQQPQRNRPHLQQLQQQRTHRPGGVEIRAKSLGDNSDDACVGDSRGAACGDDVANNGLRAAEWMSLDHAPPSQQRQRQRQVPAGSLSGGPDDDRTLNAEDECNAANGGQLEAGWLSLDLTPPSQKQAGGMSGDHPLPPQKLGQQLDRCSKHQQQQQQQMGIMGTGSSRSLGEATSLQPHAAKRAKTDSDTGMRTVAPSSAGGSRSRIRAGCDTPLPPPARRRITGKTSTGPLSQ
jgi:hypothetical protein